MKAAAHPSAAEAAARAFAEDLAVLLDRGLMEVDGIPVDDASPRFAPTAAGRAEAEGDGHEKGRRVLTIQLFTRAGERIHTATIPDLPDDEAPDVIVWGTRLFVVPDVDNQMPALDEDLAYVEALVFTLPPPRIPPVAGRRSAA